jgi:hypothetical protein
MISKTIFTVPFAALVLLGGCADPRVGPNSKTGWVTEFYTAERLMANRPACLANLSDTDIASHRYALISVPHLRSYRYVSALVPDSTEVELHDKVEIFPPLCKDGALPQVVQVLKRSRKKQ